MKKLKNGTRKTPLSLVEALKKRVVADHKREIKKALVANEAMPYSCAACNEQLMRGSQPIMVNGRGLCAECADTTAVFGIVHADDAEAGGKINLRNTTIFNAAGEVLGRVDDRNNWHPVWE
jgi:hypothetical protein